MVCYFYWLEKCSQRCVSGNMYRLKIVHIQKRNKLGYMTIKLWLQIPRKSKPGRRLGSHLLPHQRFCTIDNWQLDITGEIPGNLNFKCLLTCVVFQFSRFVITILKVSITYASQQWFGWSHNPFSVNINPVDARVRTGKSVI